MANFTRIGFGQVEPNQLSAIKTGQIYASLPLDPTVDVLQNGQFMFYNYARNMVTADETVSDDSGAASMTEAYMVYNEIKIYEDWLSYKDFAMIRVGDNYVTNKAMIGRLTSQNTDIDAVNGRPYGTTYGGGSMTSGAPVGTPANTGDVTITPAYPGATIGHTEYPYRMDGIAPRLIKVNIGDIFTTNTFAVNDEDDYVEGKVVTPTVVQYTGFNGTTFDVLELAPVVQSATNQPTTMQFVIVKKYTMPDGQTGFKVQRIA